MAPKPTPGKASARRPVIEVETISKCAQLCKGAYENPAESPVHFRYVDTFWLEGGVFGLVKDVEDKRFVVFRGTSEAANWLLTNAQAHTMTAEDLFQSPIPGGIHQGFAKAFADLWLGQSRERYPPTRNYKWTRLLWPFAMLVSASPEIFIRALRPPGLHGLNCFWALCITLASLAGVQAIFSSGAFERRFRRKKILELGPALSGVLQADDERQVIFTGHSLGGALAALAFVHYCANRNGVSAKLITFGAPRVGDDEFLQWLKAKHPGQLVVVANRGDPVAYLPPTNDFFAKGARSGTWLGYVLVALYAIVWFPYALCYRVKFEAQWDEMICWSGTKETWDVSKHTSYAEEDYDELHCPE
jgi:hypothetical protein